MDYGPERSVEFAEPADNYRELLVARGYSYSDVGNVADVLEASGMDVKHVNWNPEREITRLEGLVEEGRIPPNIDFRFFKEYAVQHALSKDASPDVAGRAAASAEQYAGAVDVKRLGVLDSEELAHMLAETPEFRHMGWVVAECAENAVEKLSADIVRYAEMVESGDRLALDVHRGPEGVVSGASHDLDRCMVMSGLAAAYGQPLDSEDTLLRLRDSGLQYKWDAFALEKGRGSGLGSRFVD